MSPSSVCLELVRAYAKTSHGVVQVSAKYLELTKRKLELTRLPHELLLPEERRWAYGTPKSVLEPLVDYWYIAPVSLSIMAARTPRALSRWL